MHRTSHRESLLELARILKSGWEEHGSLLTLAASGEIDAKDAVKSANEFGDVIQRIQSILVEQFDIEPSGESVREISDPPLKAQSAFMQYHSLKTCLEILTPES